VFAAGRYLSGIGHRGPAAGEGPAGLRRPTHSGGDMKRTLSLAVVGLSMWAAPAAFGQPGGDRPGPGRPPRDGGRPDGEVERLRAQVRELEAKLATRESDRRPGPDREARGPGRPGPGREARGPGGPGRPEMGPPGDRGPRPAARGPDDRGGPPRGPGRGPDEFRGDRRPGGPDLSRRIDRIIRELEELRREADRPGR
jgi:hypothetical protein